MIISMHKINEVILYVDARMYLHSSEAIQSLQEQLSCGEILETKYLGYIRNSNNEGIYKYKIKYVELEDRVMFKVYLVKSCTGKYEDYRESIIKSFVNKDKAIDFYNNCKDYFNNQYDTIEVKDRDYFGDYYKEHLYENSDYLKNSPCGDIYVAYDGVSFKIDEIEVEE